MCLFALRMPSLLRPFVETFISFVHFLIGLFGFLKLNFESYLYILGVSSLSDMCFAAIFSQSVACLFILVTGSFTEQKFF